LKGALRLGHQWEDSLQGFVSLLPINAIQAPERILAEHYQDLQRKPFYPALISYMSSGPMVAMVQGER
jgi:nucleoside diphosphate kinase